MDKEFDEGTKITAIAISQAYKATKNTAERLEALNKLPFVKSTVQANPQAPDTANTINQTMRKGL